MEISDDDFEKMIDEGIEAIPEKYRREINNVVFRIKDEPNKGERKKMRLQRDETLFGLYEGVPIPFRGVDYGGLIMPDTITLYKRPILDAAKSREGAAAIVADTIWHELGHHFGFDEKEVREREEKREQRKSERPH